MRPSQSWRSLADMTEARLRSVRQAALDLGVSRRTVLRRIADGELAATKVGDGRTSSYVISEDEIARALAAAAARAAS